ncbi:membrane protein implicated in regulation of membrane protease activity [Clostridium sp. CAG:575]|nr:membrane protein implicated in regulation of membrane protease activity [Clostridium sp. CAG:575]
MWQIWLLLAGLFFIGEMITVGFLIFWLGIGALLAMIVSFFTTNIIIQTAVFVISSIILILATKPFVKRFVDVKKTNTNVFSIIGKKALVIKEIDPINANGQIKVNSEIWSAESENGEKIEEGSEVEIIRINGVKAIVKKVSTINNLTDSNSEVSTISKN